VAVRISNLLRDTINRLFGRLERMDGVLDAQILNL
jgi:hypothetical protein